MYAVFCGIHIVVMVGLAVLFLLCIRKTSSPAKLSFMITCFSLFIMIYGMYLEMVDSDTTQQAIMALKLQYVGLYPFSLSMLYFTSCMAGFRIPGALWLTLAAADTASFIAIATTGGTQQLNHGLFYSHMEIETDGIYSRIVIQKGPFWIVTYVLMASIILYMIVLLIISLRKSGNAVQKRRIALILMGITAMGLELALKWTGVFGSYNPFAFGAFILMLCMYQSLIRYRYFYSVSSAPANALNSGDEGVVMLDEHGTLLYMNTTAKRILPELSQLKTAADHPLLHDALTGGSSTVNIGGSIYEIRSDRIQEFSSPCGYVVWLINMTKYQQRLDRINAANTAKTEFLARMSHEVRTPINTILGLNEMVMRTTTNSEVLEYSADIAEAGDTLLTLVNDILDISKAESGKLSIMPVQYDSSALMRSVWLLTSQKAEEKGLDFQFDISPQMPKTLRGDQARIKQMAVNLLTNAVKYTSSGFVRLSAKMDGSDLIMTVTDSGSGIKEADLPLIFNNFERIGAKEDGAGLGLPITRNIAEAMGGSVTAQSEYGRGSTFTIRIPQEIVDPAPAGEFKAKPLSAHSGTDTLFYCPDVSVLVADDNRYNRLVIEKLLGRTGVQVTSVDSGEALLKLASKNCYDVLLIDAMMPDMDGEQTLKALRSDPQSLCRDVPAAVLTADAVIGAREHYIEAGFDEYLAKPISAQQLEQLLCRLIPRGAVNDNRTSAKPAPATQEAVLNTAKGLEYSDNDPNFYRELLGVFTDELPDMLGKLSAALSSQDLTLYTTLVHGLKNNARGIGADEAADICFDAEKAARAGDTEAVKSLHGEVCERLSAAADAAEKLKAMDTSAKF